MKSKDINLFNGHKLIYESGDAWIFKPAEDWMSFQLTYGEQHQIVALDAPDLMMPLMVGNPVHEYKIESIVEVDEKFYVFMKKRYKNFVSELEKNDILWLTNSNKPFGIIRFEIKSITYHDMDRIQWYEITSKANKTVLVKNENENDNLNSKNGVKITMSGSNERMFSNIEYAKQYLYDVIQDKINELRNRQKEIMK
jgi:hypothetical protein